MKEFRVAHLDLDGAWERERLDLPLIDRHEWGPRLRFSAPGREIERFAEEILEEIPAFLLFGSGDFHHLTALWLRRLTRPTILISFDNHPDWDIRPPRWACGAWINRALELPQVERISIWGCGNFECWWPARITGNNRAERNGRLEVHPWADDRSAREQARRGAIRRENWREKFAKFVSSREQREVYVTIDLDCLRLEEAVTNWESGRFTLSDLTWALNRLGERSEIIGGDICGAWSTPRYARWKQHFAAEFDHPKLLLPERAEIQRRNQAALQRLLPALTQRDEHYAKRDQEGADR